MANPTTNYGFVMPTSTDLVTDLPADFDVFGQAVDTQMLTNANAAIAKTIVDAKGDIIAATAADTVSRLAVGANNTVLTADSTTATGLKWAAAAASGKVLQVVQATYDTETTSTSSTYSDTGLTATITPSSATSKILVTVAQPLQINVSSGTAAEGSLNLVRGSTEIVQRASNSFSIGGPSGALISRQYTSTVYLDSPATTSATTYKTQMRVSVGTAIRSCVEGTTKSTATIILMEIGA